jgi:hypothetical protein
MSRRSGYRFADKGEAPTYDLDHVPVRPNWDMVQATDRGLRNAIRHRGPRATLGKKMKRAKSRTAIPPFVALPHDP